MKISVIIVTFNNQRTIKDCLSSVLHLSGHLEIIVVDNSSADQTVEIIKSFGQKVKLIEPGTNLGFAKANNLGAKNAHGDYFIFLNPDTRIFKKGDLEKLAEVLQENPDYGLVGPKLIYPDGKIQAKARNLPTVKRAFEEYVLGRKGAYDFYQPRSSSLTEVESLTGACMVINKELFQMVGDFNEKYFMYFEDLALCQTIRKKGFKIGYDPEVVVEHAEGVSGASVKTHDFLHTSAKKYHGYPNYWLIQGIIVLANLTLARKKVVLTVVLILLAASIFRISQLDLIEFKKDEATTVYQTVQFYDKPYLMERGLISGLGVYNFPFFNYLIIILAVVSADPLYLSAAVALLNVFLVALFYLVVRKFYNSLTAVLAALLLAFSPWAVVFSRKIWAQDLILLFLIPLIGLLHSLILRKNTKTVLPIFILLTLLSQLHGSGIFFAAVTILILLFMGVPIKISKALLGIAIGLIPALPYLVFQLNASPFCPDCQALMKYQQSLRSYDLYNFVRPYQSVFAMGFHFVLGNDYPDFASRFPLINSLKYIYILAIFIPLSGIYYILIKKRELLFLLLYLLIIPFLYFLTKTEGYMHYFMTLLPIMILVFAISFNFLYTISSNRLIKGTVVTVFLSLIFANVIFLFSFYQYLGIKENISGDYGPIYRISKNNWHYQKDLIP